MKMKVGFLLFFTMAVGGRVGLFFGDSGCGVWFGVGFDDGQGLMVCLPLRKI
jgi:hypothetical protein